VVVTNGPTPTTRPVAAAIARTASTVVRPFDARGVGTGPRDEWVPWRAARPGTPLVVVTDLGISGPAVNADRADVGEWLRFAQLVRESGSELIALVPFEAGRWPPALARAMTMIHWSERTNVGAVRRARHESHARLK